MYSKYDLYFSPFPGIHELDAAEALCRRIDEALAEPLQAHEYLKKINDKRKVLAPAYVKNA